MNIFSSQYVPAAISGYGCIAATGVDAVAGYTAIENGVVRNVMTGGKFFPAGYTAPCFPVVDGGVESLCNARKELRGCGRELNRTLRLALAAIFEALDCAGLSLEDLQWKTVGIALGTTVGCTFHNEEYYTDWRDGHNPEQTPLITYLSSNIAQRVQSILGVQGPRLTITNACASGTDAIGVAKGWIESGACDIAVAGGADELSRVACHGFKSLMLVSTESCAPFDRNRAGLNLGEGAGIVVLEPEKDVRKRGGPVQGWIRGYGGGGDAHHPTSPHPDGRGLQIAVKKAMAEARIKPVDVALINAHGTGTVANDIAETNGLSALGFDSERVPTISTKGATGHTLGAAGGVEAVYTLLALNRGYVTGTIGCREMDPELKHVVLSEKDSGPLHGRIGISQSLAFGGGNGALIIEGAGS